MAQGDTGLIICNRALQGIGSQIYVSSPVPTGTDGTPAGTACATLYQGLTQALLRQLKPKFARRTLLLTANPNPPALPPQWLYEYNYPLDGITILQVYSPSAVSLLNPLPTRWQLGAEPSVGTGRVIYCNATVIYVQYVANDQPESQWDSFFVETVVKWLGSGLSMALAGRPDYARALLEQVEMFSSGAAEREDA